MDLKLEGQAVDARQKEWVRRSMDAAQHIRQDADFARMNVTQNNQQGIKP